MLKTALHNRGAIPVGVKISVAGVVLLTAVVYAFMTYSRYTKGLQSELRPARREARPQFRERMIEELNLTDEQVEKMQEIRVQGRPSSPEEGRERMEKMRELLTPEQQEKMQATRRERMQSRLNRRLERARQVLPPDQFEIYKKRLEERRNRGRRFFGGPRPRGQ